MIGKSTEDHELVCFSVLVNDGEYPVDMELISMDLFPSKNCVDVQEISVYQSLGERKSQEDHYVIANLSGGVLLAVADGHGGPKASAMATAHLVSIFSEELELATHSDEQTNAMGLCSFKIRALLHKTIDRLIRLTEEIISGSTLTLVYIETGVSNDNLTPATRITLGQLGDSVFALSTESGKLAIGPIHAVENCPQDVSEIQEVYQAQYGEECGIFGGYIFSSSVAGQGVGMTRSLGDPACILIRKAEVKTYIVDPSQSIIVLASDGIVTGESDVYTTLNTLIKLMRNGESISDIGKGIQPRNDNITLLGIRLFS